MGTMRDKTRAGRRTWWTALVYVLLPLGLVATLRHVDAVDDSTLSASVLPLPTLPPTLERQASTLDDVELLDGPPAHLSSSFASGWRGGWMIRGLATPALEAGFRRLGRRPGTTGFVGRLGR